MGEPAMKRRFTISVISGIALAVFANAAMSFESFPSNIHGNITGAASHGSELDDCNLSVIADAAGRVDFIEYNAALQPIAGRYDSTHHFDRLVIQNDKEAFLAGVSY